MAAHSNASFKALLPVELQKSPLAYKNCTQFAAPAKLADCKLVQHNYQAVI
ncbi:hypothetical protein FD50_GL000584 [Liquorilactobacillus satsumensis DSM 16230 = JCM 12392]|uniref:Uncharacterized protein n=1 Tax=Liquorilactobacillus satsumensis DSM 16230 = JCM 12392 TaxID=1423801 RepID=A0A0R1V6Z3_9LACO|nr:hypothetical protein FD50_GL000584 [Liquorilactobacillus satsumensis DSM 16230 = JCM 12392]